ncbi:hypothetical protein [Niveibacterium terrae]|uniref:hypothetical protein n=1 Tax=Niveibacterium terrae TaxID=3373598 RepID=UPI003A927D9B
MFFRFLLGLFGALVSIQAQAEVLFRCPAQAAELETALPAYLKSLDIPSRHFVQTANRKTGTVALALSTPRHDTRTLDFHARREFALRTEKVKLPTASGKGRNVDTVSRKEIVLALLQHGRRTEFKGGSCSLEALSDHVGVRQNIVAWAEDLNWVWPNGGSAKWNPLYWDRGTPKPGVAVHRAMMDVFLNQQEYRIGCYTATKLVLVQGILDYYRRVKPDPLRSRRIEAALWADGDPLVDIEPGAAWNFGGEVDPRELARAGKLMDLQSAVAPGNFVPGDWAYLLNTDAKSSDKTGYEGSNAIYLGRNRFDDYYDDHDHFYTWEQKLDEVYQWRNGVFSRSRHAHRIKPLSPEALARLDARPEDGGLLMDMRIVPKTF